MSPAHSVRTESKECQHVRTFKLLDIAALGKLVPWLIFADNGDYPQTFTGRMGHSKNTPSSIPIWLVVCSSDAATSAANTETSKEGHSITPAKVYTVWMSEACVNINMHGVCEAQGGPEKQAPGPPRKQGCRRLQLSGTGGRAGDRGISRHSDHLNSKDTGSCGQVVTALNEGRSSLIGSHSDVLKDEGACSASREIKRQLRNVIT